MAAIIVLEDLPTALQSAEMIQAMVDGANARASRVAPCLIRPTVEWDNATAYAVGATVLLDAGPSLEVTVAGTSAAVEPTAPTVLDGTVVDGTVTWKLIAPTAAQLAEAKLVLLGAVKRWAEAGAGAFQAQQAGPYGITVDTRQRTGFNLWPSEITDLQEICSSGTNTSTGAFSIRPGAGDSLAGHAPWCDRYFGGLDCSCGYALSGNDWIFEPAD